MYELIKDYKDNTALRHSFNRLAEQTFGLNFEYWYETGYWRDKYIPYSMVLDGEVVANVSVNRTDFIWNGQRKHLIQLGTVMTAEAHRNKGLIRRIMEEIEQDYGVGRESAIYPADGWYLFANDRVLDFYPKFGFVPAEEYQYEKDVVVTEPATIIHTPMHEPKDWAVLEQALAESEPVGAFEMVDDCDLIFFYVTQFMKDIVYYESQTGAYVVADLEDGTLTLHQVIAKGQPDLDGIIEAFGAQVKHVVLAFTPADPAGYERVLWKEEDCTLFVQGSGLQDFSEAHLRFPTLSHA
ncbi:MAG: GNAT family N-acetyltransferase [Lachnospiraceae bacterium]|nr:GNAT family N-acetyltransferase [Lachnospiraceae bacterium]